MEVAGGEVDTTGVQLHFNVQYYFWHVTTIKKIEKQSFSDNFCGQVYYSLKSLYLEKEDKKVRSS